MSNSESESERCSTPEYKKRKRGESSNTVSKTHRKQQYRAEWEKDSRFKGWLVKSKEGEKARCRACNAEFTAEITVIKNHAKSSKHILKIKAAPNTTIASMLNKRENEISLQTQSKAAEIKITGFLSEHNISFNSADHLTNLIKSCFPDSKIAQGMSLGRRKATQISKHVIGACAEEEIISYLKCNKFSLIIDESTDISSVKTLCICVRFFHPKICKITTLFWKLLQIFSGDDPDKANLGATSQRLYEEIIGLLSKNSIPLKNMIGFASDGCNTMFGSKNSVASKLANDIPGLMLQKCVCHSLHLCASEACKHLPRRCEDLARNVYGFFKHSAKRQAMFKEFQDFCNTEPHKILRPAQTRWLSLLQVVKRILEQWEPLKLFFNACYLEHRLIASEEIHIALNKKEIKLFYIFLEWVLPKFVDLNKYFQSENVVISHLHDKMVMCYKELLSAFVEPNYIHKTDIGKIDPSDTTHFLPIANMYLGIGVFQNIDSLEPEIKMDFLERCRKFLITSCLEIKKR
ncbi:zinc finger BED domain-containing protein 5-like [Photinus pyralis]|uniref:zinc finger BED domain-containing protein 5-like n=1 Tax=Photinus pyralis TaxID=7054 RepID=UPI001267782C|nr:zinc finger BED domain-containing protein 5-like [Photinus pyralis]